MRICSAFVVAGVLTSSASAQFLLVQPLPVVPPPAVSYYVPAAASAPAARQIERYYFLDGVAPANLSAPMRDSPAKPPRVIIREYHYWSPTDDALSRVPAEKETAEPGRKLEPLGPAERLQMPPPKSTTPSERPSAGRVPSSSTEQPPRSDATDRLYRDPNDGPNKVRVRGVFTSARGGSLLADMKLGFVDQQGLQDDKFATTDTMGRFDVSLEPGKWLVYFIYPDGGRRFLQVVTIDRGENVTLSLQG